MTSSKERSGDQQSRKSSKM
ncbi:hypothetical protein ACHAXS_000081 [Conticribra weissflogii]